MNRNTKTNRKNKRAACAEVRLYTLNGRVSKGWLLFIFGATPEMAKDLSDEVFPTTLTPMICEAAGLRNGEKYMIDYAVTDTWLTEEEVASYGDGPGVIVIDVEVVNA